MSCICFDPRVREPHRRQVKCCVNCSTAQKLRSECSTEALDAKLKSKNEWVDTAAKLHALHTSVERSQPSNMLTTSLFVSRMRPIQHRKNSCASCCLPSPNVSRTHFRAPTTPRGYTIPPTANTSCMCACKMHVRQIPIAWHVFAWRARDCSKVGV